MRGRNSLVQVVEVTFVCLALFLSVDVKELAGQLAATEIQIKISSEMGAAIDAPPTAASTRTTSDAETGETVVTIFTSDDGPIPDETVVCISSQCQLLDGIAPAAEPSGTSVTFNDLTPGSFPLLVLIRGVQVYQVTVSVKANETSDATVVLPAAADTLSSADPNDESDVSTSPVAIPHSTSLGAMASWGVYLVLLGGAALGSFAGILIWKRRQRSWDKSREHGQW